MYGDLPENGHQFSDLSPPAARQKSGAAVSSVRIMLHADLVEQRVSDIGRMRIKLLFKREDRGLHVDIGIDLFDAFAVPCPHFGKDIVDDLFAGILLFERFC
ncbi:hypothetical protein D1872_290640 [compost metagenome]